ISHNFKIAMVAVVFFLALFRLLDIFYLPAFSPGVDLISDKIILTVVLLVLVYLWIQETKDYNTLLTLNKDLEASHEQLKQAEIESISALIKAEEAKDPYTVGHSERVTKISVAIAEEMNLGEDFQLTLYRAGLLHDIGKIGIKDAILLKKEKLTDDEWEIIKSHSTKGAAILKPLKFLSEEIEIILDHHERFDGKGYPYGLKGDEIPLGALIIAVADAFDAMNSLRPYREPLARNVIIEELKKGQGTQHKAEISDTFLRLLEKRPQMWAR
ncbi:MAG: HD-GYP domain-containing protein, partial [Candidatus Omnitrophica bacterium]|nr:HD-GYP domain-containing protein [Candidatus Omnitrophota bacterium]